MARLNINKIKSIFTERDLTQAIVADKMDVDRSTVSTWINGKAIPGQDNLLKFAEALGVKPEDIMMDDDPIGINVQSPGNTIYFHSHVETINIQTLNLVVPTNDVDLKEFVANLVSASGIKSNGFHVNDPK